MNRIEAARKRREEFMHGADLQLIEAAIVNRERLRCLRIVATVGVELELTRTEPMEVARFIDEKIREDAK